MQGIVSEIFSTYWILQSDCGVFKFRITSENQKDLEKIQAGDKVTVVYDPHVIRIITARKQLLKEGGAPETPSIILDNRAFYEG